MNQTASTAATQPVNDNRGTPRSARAAHPSAQEIDATLNARLRELKAGPLRESFDKQGSFLYLEDFLPRDYTERLIEAVHTVMPAVNRNYLPGHKQGGSVSRHAIDKLAPFVADLYRSQALIGWLETISGDKLQVSPPDDPHAYALYFYTRPGDHIGWHYDTSYYDGRRYTLLLGVIDDSSCKLDYELHTKTPGVPDQPGSVQYPPGAFVFFDGDKLRHRVTPLGENEMRVSLTFEYVTNPTMRPFQRFISNMKDSIAYFGFRQVFRRKGGTNGQA
jgi:alkylated DNA repair dioxygenase AlkB